MNLEEIRHELALLERQLHELAAKIQTGEGIGRLVSDCAPDSFFYFLLVLTNFGQLFAISFGRTLSPRVILTLHLFQSSSDDAGPLDVAPVVGGPDEGSRYPSSYW